MSEEPLSRKILPDGSVASTDPMTLLPQLAADAAALDAAADETARLLREFEGVRGEQIGVYLRWRGLVRTCTLEVEREARDEGEARPGLPASERVRGFKMIEMEGFKRAEERDPELFAAQANLKVEIEGMREWMKAKERSSSIRQSILSAQKTGALIS